MFLLAGQGVTRSLLRGGILPTDGQRGCVAIGRAILLVGVFSAFGNHGRQYFEARQTREPCPSRKGELEHFVGRRYGDFVKLHRALRTELPGRVLPAIPKKNKTSSSSSGLLSAFGSSNDSEESSVSSMSTRVTGAQEPDPSLLAPSGKPHRALPRASGGSRLTALAGGHHKASSVKSSRSQKDSPRASTDGKRTPVKTDKEEVCVLPGVESVTSR